MTLYKGQQKDKTKQTDPKNPKAGTMAHAPSMFISFSFFLKFYFFKKHIKSLSNEFHTLMIYTHIRCTTVTF